MDKPTCEDFLEETMEFVRSEIIDTWRWGIVKEEICLRVEDGTYWRAIYRVSSDGGTNELREGLAEITQVCPVERIVIDYETVHLA